MPDCQSTLAEWQERQDSEHLRLLSIFYFVSAGLTGLGLLFGLFYVVLGTVVGIAPGGNAGDARMVGLVFAGVGVVVALVSLLWIGCQVLAGYYLLQARNEIFCMMIAALSCMSFPVGTALGVFTFIVLLRPSVQARFANNRGAGGAGATGNT